VSSPEFALAIGAGWRRCVLTKAKPLVANLVSVG
jgi:hypothetical protein